MAGLRAVVLIWIPAFAGKGLARGIRAARGAKACNAKRSGLIDMVRLSPNIFHFFHAISHSLATFLQLLI